MVPVIHSSAIVDAGASIGEGTHIWHWTHVCAGAQIGSNCSFGQNVFVANNVKVGNDVKVQNNVSIFDGVHLQDSVFCGPSVVFTNVINPRSHVSRKHEYKPTIIKTGASLGANVTVVCGNNVGCYAMVGAGAVVTRDVPDYALMAGVPARKIGWVCQCGERLPNGLEDGSSTATCLACDARYEMTDGNCQPEPV